jgi:uncharacterized protein (TIGR02246 family)
MNVQATQRAEAAIEAIDSAREAHVAALNTGDVDAWVAGFTDDGVQMPPGYPSNVGGEAIRAWAIAFLAPFDVNFAISPNEVGVASADWAFESGTWEITLTPKAGGEPIRDNGKYITLYQRKSDDTWAMARDIWNSSNPPPGML